MEYNGKTPKTDQSYFVFPSPQKPTSTNSNSTRNKVDGEPLGGCAQPLNRFYLFFVFNDSPIFL